MRGWQDPPGCPGIHGSGLLEGRSWLPDLLSPSGESFCGIRVWSQEEEVEGRDGELVSPRGWLLGGDTSVPDPDLSSLGSRSCKRIPCPSQPWYYLGSPQKGDFYGNILVASGKVYGP